MNKISDSPVCEPENEDFTSIVEEKKPISKEDIKRTFEKEKS